MRDENSMLEILVRIYKFVVIVFISMLFIIVAYNVIRRYLFNNSIAWADELSRYIFIWVNLLGIIAVFQNDELIKLNIVSRLIAKNPAGKYLVSVIEFLSVSIVLAVLTYSSFRFLSVMNHVSATLALPMKAVYAILPVSMSCMFVGNFVKLVQAVRKNRKL